MSFLSPTPNFITLSDSYMPILPSSLNYFNPIGATVIFPSQIQLPANYDLNKDPRTHKIQTQYFRAKVLGKWLYDDLSDLLNYFIVANDGNVRLLENLSEYRADTSANESLSNIEKKIDFIEKHILTEKTMYRILKKFVKGTGINWYDLHKNEYFVKEAIKNMLNKIIRETIIELGKSEKKTNAILSR